MAFCGSFVQCHEIRVWPNRTRKFATFNENETFTLYQHYPESERQIGRMERYSKCIKCGLIQHNREFQNKAL